MFTGWHRALNFRAGRSHLAFYLLVPTLREEADMVSIQHTLVGEQLLTQDRRKKYRRVQGRLRELWDQYAAGNLSSSKLLEACGTTYGPGEIGITLEEV